MFKLTHNDDCKGKWQSHTISICSDDYYDIYTIAGYGSTKEEAFNEFMIEFNSFMDKLRAFEKTLYKNPEIIEVDYKGDEIKNDK